MHHKLLVANRSEIACRIFQTCREMGISTVGIVAPGDEDARHLTYADEVIRVPSYLDGPAIVEAAIQSKAKLIHPGYGFLSERAQFARKVEEAGLLFVGPRAETMEMMGAKIAAKEIATQNQVPVLPWARVEKGQDVGEAAKKVGYPLLLKASAGGGGKGMRRVDRAEDLLDAAESAAAEASSAFGDGTLFLERYLAKPRHIEVQILGDGFGHGLHLYERDCSLQRRHQKIWEEARAPGLSDTIRTALFEAALKLVQVTRYRSAGTLEFLVDESGQFFFLEMNTRLQVEHPVTEMITGVDLVWAQIAQALAPTEKVLNETPSARGHSIEVRLYAEDPAQNFIPTPGRVEKLRWPTGAGIRVESGVEEGQELGTQFDSMIGKLIVYAQDRAQAIQRLRFALEETVILGVGTNQSYLHALALDPRVRAGATYTGFLGEEFKSFGPMPDEKELELWWQAKNSNHSGIENFTGSGERSHSSGPRSPWIEFAKRGSQFG